MRKAEEKDIVVLMRKPVVSYDYQIQSKDGTWGDECIVTFHQNMDMQGGEYLLSFGCTGYCGGDFTVFHRLYDACNITVVSTKNTVGFYDKNSVVKVEELSK